MEARDERRLRALQKHLNTFKLLIVDELGYVPRSPPGKRRSARCAFAPRCRATAPECLAGDILMVTLSDARAARCVRLEKPPVT
jgi:hypothetical protein